MSTQLETVNGESHQIPHHGDPCHFIVSGQLKSGTFVRFDPKGNAVVLDDQGRESTRALRDKDGKAIRFDGAKLALSTSSGFTVSERFEFLENFSDMTIRGKNNALVVAGEGGLGKTFTVRQRLELAGKIEQLPNDRGDFSQGDYRIIKGHSTPKALYRSLYENQENTIIYDDCDGILKDDKAVNILKGALDSYDRRIISWLTEIVKDSDLPMQFEFKGKVIFLTNKELKNIPQPLISRAMFVDVSMTHSEKIERMRMIAPQIKNNLSEDRKTALIDFLEKLGGRCRDLNMRTFNKVCMVLDEYPETQRWQRRVEYLVTQG